MKKSIRYETSLHPYYEKPLKEERTELKRKHRAKVNQKCKSFLLSNDLDIIDLTDKNIKCHYN